MSSFTSWIESSHVTSPTSLLPSGVDVPSSSESSLFSLFSDPDPDDTFTYTYDNDGVCININLKGYKQELGQTLNSTGLTLWRASEYLNAYLLKELPKRRKDFSKDSVAVELGAGLGLCSVLLSKLFPGRTYATDGDSDVLSMLQENVSKNACVGCEVRQVRWGVDAMQGIQADLVTASDVIYTEQIVKPLFEAVGGIMRRPAGEFWLAFARRNVEFGKVLEEAERRGMVGRKGHVEGGQEGEDVWVFTWKDSGAAAEEEEEEEWELDGPGGCTRIFTAKGENWKEEDGMESYRKSVKTGQLVYYGGAVVTARIST